jgi:hypothetical protein
MRFIDSCAFTMMGEVPANRRKVNPPKKGEAAGKSPPSDPVTAIINLIKSRDDAEQIERQILDKSNVVNRCLLPLYVIHEHLPNEVGLTTGQIGAISKDLGVPISQSNVAHTLAGPAGKFVMASRVRKRGVPVEYKINRRGVQHLAAIIKTK